MANLTTGEHFTADRADRLTNWWPRTIQAQIGCRDDRDQIVSGIKALSVPADPGWIMARVMALLSPYFTASVPEAVRVIEAEDWLAKLQGNPQWAIEKACRWWKSEQNPDHRRKPIEGDIANRVKHEMGILSFAALKVKEYDAGVSRLSEPKDEPPTQAERDERRIAAERVMAELGFTTKRMQAVAASPMARSMDEAMTKATARVPHWSETAASDDPRWQEIARIREKIRDQPP
jgi:hypothetical protein